MNKELLDYIKKELKKGISKNALKLNLIAQKWSEVDIQSAFDAFDTSNQKEMSLNTNVEVPSNPFLVSGNDNNLVIYGGFWRRAWAAIIDWILINLILLGVGVLLSNEVKSTFVFSEGLVFLVTSLAYSSILESSKEQATLGKMFFKLKVTDETGNRIHFAQALLRNVSKILSFLLIFIGYIMIAFTKKKQGLHDMIAKTLIVKK